MLLIPYVLNILILVPVCLAMFGGAGARLVFEGKVQASGGLEMLVGSLWFGILAASVFGLFMPRVMIPLLVVQVIYKALWLAVFAAPLVLRGRSEDIPAGVATCFALIVLAWPVFIWRALA